MCLLTVYREHAQPDAAALSRAAVRNPDGFGWAILIPGGGIVTHRTLDASEGVSSFVETRRLLPDGPALWHARLATHGSVTVSNCHPFTVAGDERMWMAHNGVLPLSPSPGDDRSDTRLLADDLLRPHHMDDPATMLWLSKWARGSKLAVLSVHPDTARSLYIVNESDGDWDGGVWYSNDTHRPMSVRDMVWSAATFVPRDDDTDDDDDDDGVWSCGVCCAPCAPDADVCEDCGGCLWCGRVGCVADCWDDDTDDDGWDTTPRPGDDTTNADDWDDHRPIVHRRL